MRMLTTEKWWFAQMLVMVWANFVFLAILAMGFGGFFGGNFSYLFYLLEAYGATFHLVPVAAVFGYISSMAWSKAGNKDRAFALSVLSGLAIGTYVLAMYVASRL